MKDVGGVCVRHPPCAGARAPEDKDEGKRSFPLWPGPTTFLIMIAEVLPSVSNCLSRSLFRITVRSAVASSCSSGVVFPPRKRREFTRARWRSETQGPCPMVSLRIEQLSLGNGKDTKLKLIKHDEAL